MNIFYYTTTNPFAWQAHYFAIGDITIIPEFRPVGKRLGVCLTYERVEKLLAFISRRYDPAIAEMLEQYGVLSVLEKQ